MATRESRCSDLSFVGVNEGFSRNEVTSSDYHNISVPCVSIRVITLVKLHYLVVRTHRN